MITFAPSIVRVEMKNVEISKCYKEHSGVRASDGSIALRNFRDSGNTAYCCMPDLTPPAGPHREPDRPFREQSIPRANIRSIEERLQVLERELRSALAGSVSRNRHIYLCGWDLALTIANGASRELYTAFPPLLTKIRELNLPREARARFPVADPETEICTFHDNPVFFAHMIHAAIVDRMLPRGIDSARLKNQILTAAPNVTLEYFQMLQEASRFWSKSPQHALGICAEFLGLTLALQYLGGHAPTFGVRHPVSMLREPGGDLVVVEHDTLQFLQRLSPGAKVLIGGAGLGVLANIKEIARFSNMQFALNDSDPFISKCLGHFLKACPLKNVAVASEPLSEALRTRSDLDLVLLPDLYRLNGDSVEAVSQQLGRACRAGGEVHIFQKNCPKRVGCFDAKEWESLLPAAGFDILYLETRPLVAGALENLEREEILDLDASQILSALKSTAQAKSELRLVPHRLIVASKQKAASTEGRSPKSDQTTQASEDSRHCA